MLPDHHPFLDELFRRLTDNSGALDHLFIDHICYRVETDARYRELREYLLQQGNTLLVESIIGGRSIATFKLSTPLPYGNRRIPLLELPAPKPGSFYPEGYEHVEFVTDRPLVAFCDQLPALLAVPAANYDRKGLSKARNADLRVKLGDGYNVKFHEQSLEAVIMEELQADD